MIRRIVIADTQEELDTMYSADLQRADVVIVGDRVWKHRRHTIGARCATLVNYLRTFVDGKPHAAMELPYPSD